MIINYTCSFGDRCHSSQLLKRNNLKRYSYPFDWIYSSSDNIIHCIQDNFNTFLDKSYYIDIEIKWNDNQCGHKYYNHNMFNHHDPRNEEDYNYFVRCVNRFKDLLQKQEHKLFIIIGNRDNTDITNSNLINFNKKLSKYTSNYTLLVIYYIPNKPKNNHIFTCSENIHFLELHTLSTSIGMEFDNSQDNIYLDNIIKSKYIFNLLSHETN
jgi:hypothetical protein